MFIALSWVSKRLNHITLTTYHRRDLSVRCRDIAGHLKYIVDSLKDCHNCLYNFGPLRQGIRRAPISQPPVRRHSIAILCLWKLWKGWEVDPCHCPCAKKDGSFWRWALWDTVAGGALLLLWVLGDSFKCSRSSSSCCILIEFLFESTGRRSICRTFFFLEFYEIPTRGRSWPVSRGVHSFVRYLFRLSFGITRKRFWLN